MTAKKSEMVKWKKPNGSTVTTNKLPLTLAYAMSLGWKRAGVKKEAAK